MQTLHDRLQGVKGSADNFTAKCPGHDDHANSLQVKRMDGGKISVQCYAGCEIDDVLAPVGLKTRDLYPEDTPTTKPQIECCYDYTDEAGRLLYQVVRFRPKDFRPRRPDGRGGWIWNLNGVDRVLYRQREVLQAKAACQTIYYCEGEKDSDRLVSLGLCATTAGNATGWRDTFETILQGTDLIILEDNDDAGRKCAATVASKIIDATILRLPGLPHKGDVSDWLDAGGTLEQFHELVAQARANPVEPEPVEQAQPVRPDVDALGELANAYRFRTAAAGNIVNDPALGTLVYRDGFWQPGEREAVKVASGLGAVVRAEGHASTVDPDLIKAYYSAARRAESARGVEATLKLARALPGVDATGIKWDADEWLVNVANGTVDSRTMTLMPHERSDYITRRIPIEYSPDAPCPVWESHLKKVFADDAKMIRYMQFLFGYSITASMRHQLFVICHGEAGCAKSTTIEAGMYAMGPYADAVSHDVVLDQHHSGHACTLAALCGLRFGLVSELPEGARWNEAQVKRLATGDTLAARLIGQNPFSFKSTMKLWVNCNMRPEFRDNGGGMARRIRCVPFIVNMTGPDRDLNIEQKLRDEAPGILRWILEGAQMAYQGEPEIPEAVKVSSREYVRQNDALATFIEECCEIDPRERAEVGHTYDVYKNYGGDLSKKRFSQLLLTRFDQYRDTKSRYWIGFKLSL